MRDEVSMCTRAAHTEALRRRGNRLNDSAEAVELEKAVVCLGKLGWFVG